MGMNKNERSEERGSMDEWSKCTEIKVEIVDAKNEEERKKRKGKKK